MSPRIALVHGIDRDLHDWDAVLPGLADLGDTLPVDLAGFGAAPPPADRRYSPAAHAERVARQVLDGAEGPVHLVGNSLGGLVSTLVAAREPRRVASLTLVAPALPVGRTGRAGLELSLVGIPGVGPALLPSADVRVLPHAGHLIPLEDPGDVVDAVRAQVALTAGRAS